jgi:1,2-diacylglycerol 3-alpha-glucosyltransferase
VKILIGALTYPLLNGVTTSVNTTIDGFTRAGHQMAVVAPQYELGITRPEHYIVSASYSGRMLLRFFNKKERMFGAGAREEIEKIADQFQPDAFWLHTVSWSSNAFERVMFASSAAKVLTFHTLVEQYGQLYAGEVGAAIMRRRSMLVANHMDAVITPSQAIAKQLVAYGVTRPIYAIATGVSLPKDLFSRQNLIDRFRLPKDGKILLYVGRVSEEKNIEVLLKLVKELNQSAAFTLLLVGPGDIVQTQETAKRWGIEQRVICTGPLPKEDAQRCYGGADAFVFASITETQGLVIGEAMLAGLPVVALDSPIRPEVYPETTATVVKDPAQFGHLLMEILDNRQSRLRQVATAKQFVQKNFSIEGMIKKQITVFEKVLATRARTPITQN